MRVLFLGTPAFAVPSLRALITGGHQVAGVFTQPDRPKGRGSVLASSPVKLAALDLGLPVFQPERLRRAENLDLLRSFDASVYVVVGYGQIIPQTIIDIPRYGILNVHASLLPKYRGAAPIQWAIANGDTTTGVTLMQIDAGLDTGDMLLKTTTAIGPDETAHELSPRLADLGADLLIEGLSQIEAGTIARERQDGAEATIARILKKEDGAIDWSRPAAATYNRLLGFTPWPGAYTSWRGEQLSILQARPQSPQLATTTPQGSVKLEQKRLFVACGDASWLEILELQLAGKKRMAAAAFLNGYKVTDNEVLGDAQ